MEGLIGIYVGPYYFDWDENTCEEGIGGSETWAIEISKQFSNAGYRVRLYAQPSNNHTFDNVELVHYSMYELDLRGNMKFDYFIYSRYSDPITPYLRCDNVYMMVHDACIQSNYTNIGLGRIKKYGYLSDWHKDNLLRLYSSYGLSEKMLMKVTNGFSDQYYHEVENKEKSMVWSSSLLRGFFELYSSVLYEVIRQVPEFKIYVSSGTLAPEDKKLLDRAKLLPNVEVLGKLSKKELAEYQCKSMIWVYPGIFEETFCITAVENARAGNALICPPTYGLATTLMGYELWNNDLFPMTPFVKDHADAYRTEIIQCLKDEYYRSTLVRSSYAISTKYSWNEAAKPWIKEFKNCYLIP